MELNAKERAVESVIFGVMAVGGIVTGMAMLGQANEHQAEMQNALTQHDRDVAAKALHRDRAIVGGCVVLALPGIGRFWRYQDDELDARAARTIVVPKPTDVPPITDTKRNS